MRKIIFVILVRLFFTLPNSVEAKIEVTFSDLPATVEVNQSFSLEVTVSGTTEGTNYFLRGAFYKEGSSSYFGSTLNNAGNWHNVSSEPQQFFQTTGNQTVHVQFKPAPSPSNYQGPGVYHFKIGRYTQSGSTVTWSDQIGVLTITEPTPEPSPTPTNSPEPSATITPAPTPTNTPTPTPSPQTITNISLSEIMPCPEQGSEWVEIANGHEYPVTLQSWLIRDETVNNKFSFSISIPAKGLAVIDLATAILNNTNDSVKIVDPNGNILSQMSYTGCDEMHSYIFAENTWQQTATITKGSGNVLSIPSSSAPIVNPTPSPTNKPSPTPISNTTTSGTTSQRTTPTSTNSVLNPVTEADFANYRDATLSARVLGSRTASESATNQIGLNKVAQKLISDDSPIKSVSPLTWLSLFGGSFLFIGVGGYWLWEWYNKSS